MLVKTGGRGSVHVFMYVRPRAAGAVRIAESCGQGQRWHGSEIIQFSPSTEVGMDGGGQERRERHEMKRLGDKAARPKTEGQQFAAAEGTDTRMQPWNCFNNFLASSDTSSPCATGMKRS